MLALFGMRGILSGFKHAWGQCGIYPPAGSADRSGFEYYWDFSRHLRLWKTVWALANLGDATANGSTSSRASIHRPTPSLKSLLEHNSNSAKKTETSRRIIPPSCVAAGRAISVSYTHLTLPTIYSV